MSTTSAEEPVLHALQDLQQRLPGLGREELLARLTPLATDLAHAPAGGAPALLDGSLRLCRSLYDQSRSGEALHFARAALTLATASADALRIRNAATVCGILSGDAGDLVGAVDNHVTALRLAEAAGDAKGVGLAWNNIGLAMSNGGHYELAVACYRRAFALVEHEPWPSRGRFHAGSNLASNLYFLGAIDEGIDFAHRCLLERHAAIDEAHPQSVLFACRNLVRLLVAAGRFAEARPYVDECTQLAQRLGTSRSAVAAAGARALHELASGHVDMALTRLEGALAQARGIPAALHETLALVVRVEEAAGHFDRALARLKELSDHFYRAAVERARLHVELAGLDAASGSRFELESGQTAARLAARLDAPEPPPEWDALDRLAVSAVLRMDPSGWHGKRVGALVKALALASGQEPLQALEMGLAAELHDIGMMSVPEGILSKKGPLNTGERSIVRRHVEAGADILRDDRHPRVFMARDIAAYHHARWDGTGYPDRVAQRRIPFAARACAVAEAYDAMVCGIGEGPARSMDAALVELRRNAGTQFDPDLVECFDGMVRAETRDLGVDLGAPAGMMQFQELIQSLQEDRGFV